jgi:hypothetical protein
MQTANNSSAANLRNNILIDGHGENQLEDGTYRTLVESFKTFVEMADDSSASNNENIAYLASESGIIYNKAGTPIGEAGIGVFDLNDSQKPATNGDNEIWTTVNLSRSYDHPVIIAELSSYTGPNTVHVRINVIDGDTFQIYLEEWVDFENTNHHNLELVSYMVFEEGKHQITNTKTLLANLETPQANRDVLTPIHADYYEYEYGIEFKQNPLVFSQTQTYNNDEQVWMRQKDVNAETVKLYAQTEKQFSTLDSIGVVAIGEEMIRPVPIANDDNADVDENDEVTINILINDSNLDGIEITFVQKPAHGKVTIVNNEVKYTPTTDYYGPDQFTYEISSKGGSDQAIVYINVNEVNFPPVQDDYERPVVEDETTTVDILLGTDLDEDTVTIKSIVGPSEGDFNHVGDATTFTYKPVDNPSDKVYVDYVLTDGIVDVPVRITLNITAKNDAPVQDDYERPVVEDETTTVDILLGTDADEDTVTVVSVDQPSEGTLIYVPGAITFAYDAVDNPSDTVIVTYYITDGNVSEPIPVKITLDITEVNDDPEAPEMSLTTKEDTPITFTLAEGTDADGDLLEYSKPSTPTNGTIKEGDDGELIYTPNPGYIGDDSFTYTISDGNGGEVVVLVPITVVEKESFNVEFDANGGLTTPATQYIKNGGKATSPTINRTGYNTAEWQLEGELFDFSTEITGNIVLIAKWKPIVLLTPAANFDSSKAITINTLAEDVVAYYYTTEGTLPRVLGASEIDANIKMSTSKVDFNITSTTTVKAIVVDSKGTVSDVASVTYTKNTVSPTPTPTPRPTTKTSTVSISLDTDEVELEYGTESNPAFFEYDLTETISGSTDKDVTWEIEDPEVATVDKDGVVKALSEGNTVVTVTYTDSGETATIIVYLVGNEQTPLGAIEFFDPYVFGYPDKSFGPTRPVTRAEIATMFSKILKLNIENPGTNKFTDVKEDTWYFNYVQAIQRTGLFVGDTAGNFRPNDPISRGEMATVFVKYWRFLNIDVADTKVDIIDVSDEHWASEYIYTMYNAGIVSSFEDGTYKPNDATLREQVVGMINTLIARPENTPVASKFIDITPVHWAYGNIEAASQEYIKEQVIITEE